ncbi:MAG: hypothetical protein WBE30_00005 [Candidatus Cybelea sp.]
MRVVANVTPNGTFSPGCTLPSSTVWRSKGPSSALAATALPLDATQRPERPHQIRLPQGARRFDAALSRGAAKR